MPVSNPSENTHRVPIIDLIRFLSIFWVMGLHFFISGASAGYSPFFWRLINKVFANGSFGVTCFFVVSGFVITKMLIGENQDFSGLDLRSFYVKRVARLFPLLAVILLAGLAILQTHPQNDYPMGLCYRAANSHFNWDFWAAIFTFTFNWFILLSHQDVSFHWGVLWSLAVEEQFYLFYPLIVRNLRTRQNVIRFLTAVIVSAALFRAGVHFWAPRDFLMSTIASFAVFDQIALGALLYFLLPSAEKYYWGNPVLAYGTLFAGLGILSLVYFDTSIVDTGLLVWTPVCLAAGCALMILGGIHINALNSPFWRTLSWPGQLSYGGYLWHVTVLFLLWPVFAAIGVWAPFLYYSCVGLLSYASYRWFEIPANHGIRKFFGIA